MKKSKSKKNHILKTYWLPILLLLLGIFYVIMLQFSGTLLWDEMVYLSNARSHIGPSFFTEDFRFPLLELVISGGWLITGESILVAQTITILFSLLGVYGMSLLSKEFLDKKWTMVSTLLFSVASPFLIWGFRIYTDIPAMTLFIFATYFFIKFSRTKNNLDIFHAGLFSSLAFLMRFPTVITGVIIGAYVLSYKNWKVIEKFILGNALVLLPWMIVNTIAYNNPFWDFFAQSSAVSTYTSWQSPMLLIKAMQQTFSFGLLFLIPFLFWTFQEKKKKKTQILFMLLTINLITYLFLVNLKFERYILMFLPFIVLAITLGFKETSSWLKKTIPKQYVVWSLHIIMFILIISMVSFSIEKVEKIQEVGSCEKDGALDQATQYVKETTPMGETILSNHWPWFGYYGNHQTLAIYNNSISSILDLHHVKPTKVAYMQYQGLYFNTDELQSDERLILNKVFSDSCGFKVEVYDVDKSLKTI